MQSINVAGKNLEFEVWPGEIEGPTLVLLHQGIGSVALWREFPEQLAQRFGLEVMAYSRAGHGGSDPNPLPWPLNFMENEALDVLPGVLQAAGIDDAVLIGHSDGGTIALVTCSSEARPRVRAVVTLAAHVFLEDVCEQGIRRAGEAYRNQGLREKLEAWHGQQVDTAFYGWHDTWLRPEFAAWTIEPFLPAVDVPALVVQGLDDEYGTPAQVEAIAGKVTGPATPHLIERCGHSIHRDQPDALFEAMATFFTRHGIPTK